MQRAAQSAHCAGDAGVEVRQGRGTDSRSKRGSVELVLSIKNQGNVHAALVIGAGLFPVYECQQVACQRVLIGFGIDPFAMVSKTIPVTKHRRETGQQPLSDRILGRVVLEDVIDPYTGEILISANTELDELSVSRIEKAGIEEVVIRSVLTCSTRGGVCAL